MYWHHVIARLDDWRHFFANGFSIDTWFGNVPPDLLLLGIVLAIIWIRVLIKDEHAHKAWRQIFRDEFRATVHQLEGAEEQIADDIVNELNATLKADQDHVERR